MVRVQLELAQVKADIDRRIHEKEEEFEITRSEQLLCLYWVKLHSKKYILNHISFNNIFITDT